MGQGFLEWPMFGEEKGNIGGAGAWWKRTFLSEERGLVWVAAYRFLD